MHGGHFVSGENGGWQADSLSDSLDYNIPTCSNCRVEFDVTNVDRSTPPEDVDQKWFSMGDGSTFNDFFAFRDHVWKMHIEKRSGDGGAIKLIWRRGCNDSDSCDNTDNFKVADCLGTRRRSTTSRLEWGAGAMCGQRLRIQRHGVRRHDLQRHRERNLRAAQPPDRARHPSARRDACRRAVPQSEGDAALTR